MSKQNKSTRTTVLTLPELIRKDLERFDIPFTSLKTTPNFRYFLTAETEAHFVKDIDTWASEYVDSVAKMLGERPESFKVGDPNKETSDGGHYYRLTILIKAVGYEAPKRERMVQLEMNLDDVVVEPKPEPEVVVEPTVERVILPATPMPALEPVAEKPKRVRKPGIKKAAKETEDVAVA